VFDTAIEMYARHGWAGFTFEAVTRGSGIGKAALYRRWTDRGALLSDTLRARWFDVEAIDTGSLRTDLHSLAVMTMTHMTSSYGRAAIQMIQDTWAYPEVATATGAYRQAVVAASRTIVLRGIRRHELPKGTSPGLILDLVVGGAMNHVANTPPDHVRKLADSIAEVAQALVDVVLDGVAPEPARTAGGSPR